MPTGTLCAERNAIGNALAGDQTLCRRHLQGVALLLPLPLPLRLPLPLPLPLARHLQGVAVLSLTLDRDSGEILGAEPGGEGGEVALNPLDPCGACMEWLKKVG